MLQPRTLRVVALLGLLASTALSTAASAGERAYYRGSNDGQYSSDPRVRFGIDVEWGGYGYGYSPPPPPVAWYPAYYEPPRYYYRGPGRGSGRGHHKHRKHDRHEHRWEDCDD